MVGLRWEEFGGYGRGGLKGRGGITGAGSLLGFSLGAGLFCDGLVVLSS